MKLLNKLVRNCLFVFVLSFCSYTPAKSQIIIQTIVPSNTISICLDTFDIQIILKNDTTVTLDSVAAKHIFPAGIYFTGIFTGADSVDNTNPNAPVFFIDSIAGNGFASITLSVFAGSDFTDFYNNKNPTI